MYDDPIFRFREVLTPDYISDHLPHRERELKAISSLIDDALHSHITNIFIYGPPGTSKTASVKFIFQKLREETNVLSVYLNWRNS
jgi:cell division control protein 6